METIKFLLEITDPKCYIKTKMKLTYTFILKYSEKSMSRNGFLFSLQEE